MTPRQSSKDEDSSAELPLQAPDPRSTARLAAAAVFALQLWKKAFFVAERAASRCCVAASTACALEKVVEPDVSRKVCETPSENPEVAEVLPKASQSVRNT